VPVNSPASGDLFDMVQFNQDKDNDRGKDGGSR
jgi:hypothetical protein